MIKIIKGNKMIGVHKDKVLLVPYDKNWESEFIQVKNKLKEILSDNVLEICHIGSTAIKGMMAKPILDINVIIKKTT